MPQRLHRHGHGRVIAVGRRFLGMGGLITALLVGALGQPLVGDVGPSYPKAAKGEACVEPTDIMRRSHFQFILHQRDDTVHQGIRSKKHSLKGCIDCHATQDDQGRYRPINAEGQFCQSCHAYTATRIDCFECHATKPATEELVRDEDP